MAIKNLKHIDNINEECSSFDMFCDEHFREALDHITDRYPEHSVGFCEAVRDEEFDDDESMRCVYPEFIKESTHEVHWIKFEENKKK